MAIHGHFLNVNGPQPRGFSSGVRVASIWSRAGSNRGGSTSFSPRCPGVLVGGEARPQRRDLEQHAAGLAEVDRAEPEAVDHRRGPRAVLRHGAAPLLVVVHRRREGHVVHGARGRVAALGRRAVVGQPARALVAAQLPAPVGLGEAQALLQQVAAGLRVRRVGAHAVEALQRHLARHLRVVGDQRGVGGVADAQLVLESLGIREHQAVPVAAGLGSLVGQAGRPEVQRLGWTRRATRSGAPCRRPAGPAGPRVLEEGQVGSGGALLVGVEQVVDGRVVLVDGLLDQPQAQDAGVEVEVARCVGRDRGDVVDALELHGVLSPMSGLQSVARTTIHTGNCVCNHFNSTPRRAQLDELELGAWRGFLRTHAALSRQLDAELTAATAWPSAPTRCSCSWPTAPMATCACPTWPTPCCSAAAG